MNKLPKVSIIIRTKNEERWITNCLDKIFSQSYKNLRLYWQTTAQKIRRS